MLVRELPLPFEPAAHFARLLSAHDDAFLLESAEGPERLARYSILGLDPAGKVRLEKGKLLVDGGLPPQEEGEAPLAYLRRLLALHPTTDHGYRYLGGLVGYSSYELTESLEKLAPRGGDPAFPTFEYGLYLDGLVFDHMTRRVVYFSHGKDRSAEFTKRASARADVEPPRFGAPRANVDAPRFEKMVETVDGYGERVEHPDDLPKALARAQDIIRTEKRQVLLNVVSTT